MNWIIFALVGSTAQLIDGSLGMGFGLTSSTLLLTLGTSAAVASAAVHFAEIGTTLASGVFGNDKAWITGAIKAATAKCERMMRVLRALKNCDSLILL